MNLFRNTEVKRVTFKFIAFQIAFACILFAIININMQSLKTDIMKQNYAVAGKILANHPELKNDVVACFTKEATENDFLAGEKILREYGYDEKLPIKATYIMDSFYNKFIYKAIFLMGVYFIFSLIIILGEYKKIFKKINTISVAAEGIVEGGGNFTKVSENGEGEFSLLSHNFNEMANRLDFTIQELNKEKVFLKDTVSDISHQLKTPLASLKVFNELIIDGRLNEEQYIDVLEKSKQQIERMEWLIINLLKMARMEVGTIEFKMGNNSLIETIESSLSSLNVNLKQKRQKLIINEKGKNIYMRHDSHWLSEAFTNIVKNCIEHTYDEGEIYIEVDETPLMVNVMIKDNGEGISSEDLPHIFERFYKSGDRSDSVGIGLSLAKTIIEKHEGTIKVKSDVNVGTEFNIMFLKNIV